MDWSELAPLDGIVLTVFAIAVARGLFIGLIREGFSIAALGGSFVAVRYGVGPVGSWLDETTKGELGTTAPWIAGAVIAVFTILAISIVGRVIRRGARLAGLGIADRLAGGVVGAAEGALVAGLVIVGATWVTGPDSDFVSEARSVHVLEQLQEYVESQREGLPAVAAPPRDT